MSIGNWLQIGNRTWNVRVMSVNENMSILYSENTGRTMSSGARMTLDPLGTFIGHKITVERKDDDLAEFDSLFDFLCIPRYNGINVKAVHNQTTISYDAYISSASRDVERIDDKGNKVYYKQMEINIIPMEAQIIP